MNNFIIDNKSVGQRLRSLRGKKTLKQVSDDTGINISSLTMYELGERMPRDKVKVVLADYYGVDVGKLFFTIE